MGVACPPGSLGWAARLFGDCVSGPRGVASLAFGLLSIVTWGVAEVPQIWENFKKGRSEGVSLAFISTWLLGDAFNLAGCFLTPTLPTQLYTAVLYTAATVVLILQHLHYEGGCGMRGKARRDADEAALGEPLLADAAASVPGAGSQAPPAAYAARDVPHPSRSHNDVGFRFGSATASPRFLSFAGAGALGAGALHTTSPRSGRAPGGLPTAVAAGGVAVASTIGLAAAYGAVGGVAAPGGGAGRALLTATAKSSEHELLVGTVLGWSMTGIYLCGRVPQIMRNWQRGSVEGLSIAMFLLAIAGNSTYFASIVVRSTAWEDIKPNLPWLVDAALCLVLDFVIYAQYVWYTRGKTLTAKKDCDPA